MVEYFCPLHACKINSVNIHLIYVHMRFTYVDMQHNYVDIQHMHVNMRVSNVC